MYGQPMYGQPGMAPPGMAPPSTVGMPGMGPPPPQFLQSWFAMYYNMIQPHEWAEISGWFQAVDRDRSGSIGVHEIASCTFGGFPLGFDCARKLIRVFDKDGNGHIAFHEYASLHKFLSLCQAGFFGADRDRSGRLHINEVFTALAITNLQVSLPSVTSLYNNLVKDPFGLTFSEFLMLAATIASAKSVFFHENLMQGNRGVVQLDFDKLLFLASRIV